jgi:hypothetical protein
MPNHIEAKISLAFGPPVPSATPAKYSHTDVVVTDASGKPQPAVRLGTGKADLTAIVQQGGGGNVVATDYDVDGKVLNTVVQEFSAAGTVPDYKPTTTITVVPGEVVKPGVRPVYSNDPVLQQNRQAAVNKTNASEPSAADKAFNPGSPYNPAVTSKSPYESAAADRQTHSSTPTSAIP